MPSSGFTGPGGGGECSPGGGCCADERACLAFGWVCSVTGWQAPNQTPVCVCVCVYACHAPSTAPCLCWGAPFLACDSKGRVCPVPRASRPQVRDSRCTAEVVEKVCTLGGGTVHIVGPPGMPGAARIPGNLEPRLGGPGTCPRTVVPRGSMCVCVPPVTGGTFRKHHPNRPGKWEGRDPNAITYRGVISKKKSLPCFSWRA